MATQTEREDEPKPVDKEEHDASSNESLAANDISRQQEGRTGSPSTPDEEKQKPPVASPGPPPNGGTAAWLQVLGGWMLFFNTWGILKSVSARLPAFS